MRLILDGKVSGTGDRYDTLEQLLKEAKQLGHMNERKHEEVENQILIVFLFLLTLHYLINFVNEGKFKLSIANNFFIYFFLSSFNLQWSQRSRTTYIPG
jgi:hypothetical protein